MSKETKKPVRVSGGAVKALGDLARRWAEDDMVTLSVSTETKVAHTDLKSKRIVLNPDVLVRNPNRVLNLITPFRLRQEAVVTGALLHEVAHLRYSKWMPRSVEELKALKHSDGKPVAPATRALATLLEEPRIEGRMASDMHKIGGYGLTWTMRASAAAIVPPTPAAMDPSQQMVDLIGSWALRAGRVAALGVHVPSEATTYPWVRRFDNLVVDALWDWMIRIGAPTSDAHEVWQYLIDSVSAPDDGPDLLDTAREILNILFPDDGAASAPSPSMGTCSTAGDSGGSEGSDASDSGDDEGEGSDDEGSDDEGSDDEGDGDSDDEGDGDSDEGGSANEGLADALSQVEGMAAEGEEEAAAEEGDKPVPSPPEEHISSVGNSTTGGSGAGAWKRPTPADREVQRNATDFLRTLLAPTEGTVRSLSETPSATVDGAAFSAWKAGGRVGEPMFFVRTRREVVDAPPARIAILVDISGSMAPLQKPSALLSWALSCAAVDLRNFAGRGRRVESCLIHWGSGTPQVIQKNGELLPGLREVPCDESTTQMGAAVSMIETEMPGFFDKPAHGHEENRLLIQFTDWELSQHGLPEANLAVMRALLSGVNMLTVAPSSAVHHRPGPSALPYIEAALDKVPGRGRSETIIYNRRDPEAVWTAAKNILR